MHPALFTSCASQTPQAAQHAKSATERKRAQKGRERRATMSSRLQTRGIHLSAVAFLAWGVGVCSPESPDASAARHSRHVCMPPVRSAQACRDPKRPHWKLCGILPCYSGLCHTRPSDSPSASLAPRRGRGRDDCFQSVRKKNKTRQSQNQVSRSLRCNTNSRLITLLEYAAHPPILR